MRLPLVGAARDLWSYFRCGGLIKDDTADMPDRLIGAPPYTAWWNGRFDGLEEGYQRGLMSGSLFGIMVAAIIRGLVDWALR